ncbi:J domain-containing protein [Ferrimonas marina]|uniref:DnaJ domain-containing protein n=1 Tax=Ferrimonas marina TaxID=299255 RepID=A0A1M5QZQ6_9GAMM|nr:DnaJ domain-containing protein [Ferrimonas marina]
MQTNYYSVLGLSPNADAAVIKAAYRTLCKKYHPDRFTGNKAEANRVMQAVNEAYATLSDAGRRAAYDRRVTEGVVRQQEQWRGHRRAAVVRPENCDLQRPLRRKQNAPSPTDYQANWQNLKRRCRRALVTALVMLYGAVSAAILMFLFVVVGEFLVTHWPK